MPHVHRLFRQRLVAGRASRRSTDSGPRLARRRDLRCGHRRPDHLRLPGHPHDRPAALAGKNFAHHEVSYIVGLGGTGAVAAALYFSIAFGKVTITTLNAYGSFMSIATIVSGFRGNRHISSALRLTYIFAMVGIATALALL
nr:hypothetical protein [Tanacetum cinerariifolium]